MVEELYVKKLPVIIKLQDHEDRKVHIQIAVELHTVSTPVTRKELIVRLTDEKDHYLLYNMKLSEEDFQSLKVQLGLLVDFGVFPRQFIGLLDQCLQEEHKEVPKFILHLVCNGTTLGATANLNVIETNQFRHLTHLSLKFLPGTDAEIKRYLSDSLKTCREQQLMSLQRLGQMESELTTQLRQTREALATRTQELSSLKPEYQSKINELINRHNVELNAERDKTAQRVKEQEQSHQKAVTQLECRLQELDSSVKELTDIKYKSESALREYKCRLGVAEEENNRLKQDIASVRREYASSGSDKHEQDKLITQLRMRLAVLEQEIKDKEDMMRRTTDLLGAEQEFKKKYEEESERKKRHINKLEVSLKSVSAELVKANEIIHKLQGEIKTYHTKLKLRTQITSEQEKLLGEKQREMEELRRDLDSTKSSLVQKGEENKKLNESLDNTLQKLEESRHLLKTNENVISWLNKQITEQQINAVPHQRLAAGMFEMPNSLGPSPTGTMRVANSTSYGSNPSYRPLLSTDPSPIAAPLSKNPATVHYQLPVGRSSQVPVPINKSTPISAGGPPGGSGNQDPQASPVLGKGTTNDRDGFLDPKYLQQSNDDNFAITKPQDAIGPAISVRTTQYNFASKPSASSTSVPFMLSSTQNPAMRMAGREMSAPTSFVPGTNQRLDDNKGGGRAVERPRTAQPPPPPPLVSSYFPSKVS